MTGSESWLESAIAIVLHVTVSVVLAGTLTAPPVLGQNVEIVQLEENEIGGNGVRLSHPVLISNQRGYRIRCAEQAHEEAVIRGLGFLTLPSTLLTAIDPKIVAAKILENPLLCPSAADYRIKVFAHNGPGGQQYYLHFPDGFGSSSFTDRLYTPGCIGLVRALEIDLEAATQADPTPFFSGKIHRIDCLVGDPVQAQPRTFADWCVKADRTPGETAAVMALLDSTPEGIAALDEPVECANAQSFLESLSTLDLSGFRLSALAPLAVLKGLTSLLLADNEISNLKPLAGLRSLVFLDLSDNRISNLTSLAVLDQLTDLKLNKNVIDDLRPIASVRGLRSLELSGNQIENVSPLGFNQALTSLDLSFNELTGDALEALTGLNQLTDLDLSHNRIETVEHLGEFPSTTSINLTGNPLLGIEAQSFLDVCVRHRDEATPFGSSIRELIAVAGESTCESAATALGTSTSLDLSGKAISDLRPLAFFDNLRTLDLSDNGIVEVAPLARLTRLSKLDLSNNNISDIRPIAPLTRLTELTAAGNPIQVDDYLSACLMKGHEVLGEDQVLEVDALFEQAAQETCFHSEDWLKRVPSLSIHGAGLRTVRYFSVARNARVMDLSGNELVDVSPLEALPLLRELRLRENRLSSLTSLLRLRRLEILVLDQNPITSLHGIEELDELRQISLSNTRITSIRPLAGLQKLEKVTLQGLETSYASFGDYCLVHKFDTTALQDVRPFMIALESKAAADNVDMSDCLGLDDWASHLKVLRLNKQDLVSIAPISHFTDLEEVYLFDNRITDATPLRPLKQLRKINLARNDLSGFPLLQSQKLTSLHLQQNKLRTTTSLQGKTSLRTLLLRHNQLQDASPLASLTNLTFLDLRNNLLERYSEVAAVLRFKPLLEGNPVCANPVDLLAQPSGLVAACQRDLRDVLREAISPEGLEIDFGDLFTGGGSETDPEILFENLQPPVVDPPPE